MAEPRSTDKWERRRRRAIVFTIVSVLLALLVADILVVAFDRWVHPVMSPNRVGGRAHEIHDAEAEMHGVRGADAPDGLRGEPAQGYGVHVRVREMWTH